MTLTARFIKTVEPDTRLRRYRDGANGLMLAVQPLHRGGSKQWIARIQCRGRRTDYGLGSPDYVSLADARKSAAAIKARAVLARHGFAEEAPEAKPHVPTFRVAAKDYRALHAPRWRKNTLDTFDSNLRTHVLPKLGGLAVDEIHGTDVLRVAGPLFAAGKAAAGQSRANIRRVLDMCVSHGLIQSNPANGSLDAALPKATKATRHHEALPWKDAPAAYAAVSALEASSASLCLRFLMLTGVRPGTARLATWAEFDLDARVWTVPAAEGRKAKYREHVVPLSKAALDVLAEARALYPAATHVFRAVRQDAPMTDTLREAIKAAGIGGTAHGWRSTFRDWCAEHDIPRDLAEHALAHAVGDKTEMSYARTTLIDKRRPIMEQWADYLEGKK